MVTFLKSPDIYCESLSLTIRINNFVFAELEIIICMYGKNAKIERVSSRLESRGVTPVLAVGFMMTSDA